MSNIQAFNYGLISSVVPQLGKGVDLPAKNFSFVIRGSEYQLGDTVQLLTWHNGNWTYDGSLSLTDWEPEIVTENIEYTINWGDGTKTDIDISIELPDSGQNNQSPNIDLSALYHKYPEDGEWTITIENYKSGFIHFPESGSGRLIKVLTPFPANNKRISFCRIFTNCRELEEVCEYLFSGNPNAQDFFWCLGIAGKRLRQLPENIFFGCTEAIDFSGAFDSQPLYEIPPLIFSQNPKARFFFQTFGRWDAAKYDWENPEDAAKTIPAGLFAKNPLAEVFQSVFLSGLFNGIPLGLFDNCSNAKSFRYAFEDNPDIEIIPEGLFDNCPNVEGLGFEGVFNGTGVKRIPDRLFKNYYSLVTSLRVLFLDCPNLENIPIGIFDNFPNAVNFSGCFGIWYSGSRNSVTEIPSDLFINSPKAINFSYCFSGTRITQIPPDLFVNSSLAEDFSYCFSYCESLQVLPPELFANNPLALNFRNCFAECIGLRNIPPGLFANNPGATNFSYCFRYCSALLLIPPTLFDNNRAVTTFNYCFQMASAANALTGVAPVLWTGRTNPTPTGTQCFRNCLGLSNYSSIPSSWR